MPNWASTESTTQDDEASRQAVRELMGPAPQTPATRNHGTPSRLLTQTLEPLIDRIRYDRSEDLTATPEGIQTTMDELYTFADTLRAVAARSPRLAADAASSDPDPSGRGRSALHQRMSELARLFVWTLKEAARANLDGDEAQARYQAAAALRVLIEAYGVAGNNLGDAERLYLRSNLTYGGVALAALVYRLVEQTWLANGSGPVVLATTSVAVMTALLADMLRKARTAGRTEPLLMLPGLRSGQRALEAQGAVTRFWRRVTLELWALERFSDNLPAMERSVRGYLNPGALTARVINGTGDGGVLRPDAIETLLAWTLRILERTGGAKPHLLIQEWNCEIRLDSPE